MMAEFLLLERNVEGAKGWIQRAICLMNANSDLYFSAEIHRLAAVCDKGGERTLDALRHLRAAIDLARAQRAKLFEPWPEILRAHSC